MHFCRTNGTYVCVCEFVLLLTATASASAKTFARVTTVYPAIHSIGWDTKCTVCFLFVCMYGYRSLSRGFTDRHKILHGGSPDLRLVFSYFGGIAPGIAEFWALIGRHMAGYASC